jgi:hypothetical protein
MNLPEVVQWLMQEGYILKVKNKYVVTAKFNKIMTGKETGVVLINNQPLVMESVPAVVPKVVDWTAVYQQFIVEAEVPFKGEGKDGTYDLNRYSEPAMNAFKRMISKQGIVYEVLVKSTMLYYKTHKRYPFTISRYIEEGLWRNDYFALLSSAKEGKTVEHIKQEIDNNTEFSRFKRG